VGLTLLDETMKHSDCENNAFE